MLQLPKYSFGVGDRFAHQASAQLRAFELLADKGVMAAPVWNKSNREHTFVGSEPKSVFDAASQAVVHRNWKHAWFVDADHIQLATVEKFLETSNFFTIDVADYIGKSLASSEIDEFVSSHEDLPSELTIPGMQRSLQISRESLRKTAEKYLLAVKEAAVIYRHIESSKKLGEFVAEVSMDETDAPQTPQELLVILIAMSDFHIPLQTIAPKFTGRFNKGVDYEGDIDQFEREFREDLAVIDFAIKNYGLPSNLKLSVHSGSDKFSLYPVLNRAIRELDIGIHIKTAGTTWLEELIGLAESNGEGLELAKEIYSYAVEHIDELCKPYASVISVDTSKLPSIDEVKRWDGRRFAETLRHVPCNPHFNPHLRQLLHVSFKVAAKAGNRYTDLLKSNAEIVGKQVTENLFDRHMSPIFLGQ